MRTWFHVQLDQKILDGLYSTTIESKTEQVQNIILFVKVALACIFRFKTLMLFSHLQRAGYTTKSYVLVTPWRTVDQISQLLIGRIIRNRSIEAFFF